MGKAREIRRERFESVEGGGRATAADVEAIARRVVEMLGDRLIVMPASRSDLIDAAELARRLGTRRSWVYAHAMELGAIRLGGSGRPRLRFDAKAAMDSLRADGPTPAHGRLRLAAGPSGTVPKTISCRSKAEG